MNKEAKSENREKLDVICESGGIVAENSRERIHFMTIITVMQVHIRYIIKEYSPRIWVTIPVQIIPNIPHTIYQPYPITVF